jgi:hypothetical protein
MPDNPSNDQKWNKGDTITAARLEQMRQDRITDVSVDAKVLSVVRNGSRVAIGLARGRGSLVPTVVVKLGTLISSQLGRFNLKRERRVAKGNATGAVAEADFATFPSVNDAIGWEMDAANLRVGIDYGVDSTSGLPIIALLPRGTFPVKIAKDGGAQGTQSAAATWTYTVKTLAGDTIKATVPLARPRPVGTATVQADDSFGLAFYAGGDIKLWDAGEIYGAAPCPP